MPMPRREMMRWAANVAVLRAIQAEVESVKNGDQPEVARARAVLVESSIQDLVERVAKDARVQA